MVADHYEAVIEDEDLTVALLSLDRIGADGSTYVFSGTIDLLGHHGYYKERVTATIKRPDDKNLQRSYVLRVKSDDPEHD